MQMISLIALEVALCYRFLVSCYVYAQKGRTYIWASDVVMLQLSIDNWFWQLSFQPYMGACCKSSMVFAMFIQVSRLFYIGLHVDDARTDGHTVM